MSNRAPAIDDTRSALPFPLLRQGKVRELYDLGDCVLLVASDRISAFDCILPQTIPDKGAVLTQLSSFWFSRTSHVAANHCITADPDLMVEHKPSLAPHRRHWAGRGMLVRRAKVFPVECVVRGHLAGSAWKEYRESGTLAGEKLPAGLVEAQALSEPIFSPASKAEEGHDENISFEAMGRIVGTRLAEHLRRLSLDLYQTAAAQTVRQGLILADTKFEFGTAISGEIMLVDEALTPDSSRFWDAEAWKPGRTPRSADKQPVRDYLEGLVASGDWDRSPPAPDLPEEVVNATGLRYRNAFRTLAGYDLPEFA